jgi:predicted nucleotidyltransferase
MYQSPEINQLLDVLLTELQDILKDRLVGFYLYGSLVWGDFDVDISDIDLLAATASDITGDEFNALQQMHDNLAAQFPNWDNRIEVQYFSAAGLKTFKTQSHPMGNISPGEPFHIITAGREWLMNWYFVQEFGITLFGPPPDTLIDHVTHDEFIQRVRDDAVAWRERINHLGNATAQSYAILTLCRGLYTVAHRQHVSKRQAVEWASIEFPQWSTLIQNALIWRKNPSYGTANLTETQQFTRFLIDQILISDGDGV